MWGILRKSFFQGRGLLFACDSLPGLPAPCHARLLREGESCPGGLQSPRDTHGTASRLPWCPRRSAGDVASPWPGLMVEVGGSSLFRGDPEEGWVFQGHP